MGLWNMDKGLSWEYAAFWRRKEASNKRTQPDGLGCWWAVSGKSRGYWVEIARSRPEREAEARHSTTFGKHWAGSRQRPNGRSYTIHQSPYDPEPGVGIWQGCTAPPPRIGPAAPKRWPAEAPDGLRPYEYKWAQALASRLITDQLRLSNDRCNYRHLRDHKAHILERRRHSGSLFQDKAEPSAAQFARGVRWAELESIELYRRHDQLRWFIRASVDDKTLDFSAEDFDKRSIGGETGITGAGMDSSIANQAGFAFEDVDNAVENLRGHPPRERCKAGRKPLGEHAMTTAERVAKHRARKKLLAPATHGRFPAGAGQSPPLGLAVPASTFDQGATMSETLPMEATHFSAPRKAELVEPRCPKATATQVYAGYSSVPIELRLLALSLPLPPTQSRETVRSAS